MSVISVGDRVQWRGCFGMDTPMSATVERMEVTEHPRSKYGEPAESVAVELVRANRVVFSLSNGHWCYSEQIDLPVGR